MQFNRSLIGALMVAGAMCAAARAQTFTVDWFTLDGGGAMGLSGGGFEMNVTIGQPDASPATLTGGPFELTTGFWSVAAAPPPAPCTGDLNGDKKVGQEDLGILLAAYDTCPGEPGYSAPAGLLAPEDPCVNQADLGVLLAFYGVVCP